MPAPRRVTSAARYRDSIDAADPFDTAEEAWFWFIQAQQARNDGARFSFGASMMRRPCEPADILTVLERLYRNRRLVMDHLLVLRHYGRRQMPPDPGRPRERRAAKLWGEALDRLEEPLIRKGIVTAAPGFHPFPGTGQTGQLTLEAVR